MCAVVTRLLVYGLVFPTKFLELSRLAASMYVTGRFIRIELHLPFHYELRPLVSHAHLVYFVRRGCHYLSREFELQVGASLLRTSWLHIIIRGFRIGSHGPVASNGQFFSASLPYGRTIAGSSILLDTTADEIQ
jgi:hypothetical protein